VYQVNVQVPNLPPGAMAVQSVAAVLTIGGVQSKAATLAYLPSGSPPPPAPGGLVPAGLGPESSTLQWLPVSLAAGYAVTLTDPLGGVVLQQNVAGTSLGTPTLEKGKTYCFSVTAYNPVGSSPPVSRCFAVWPGYGGNWISASGILVTLGVVTVQVSPYYSYPNLWGGISGLSCYSGATPITGDYSTLSALTELPDVSMVVMDVGSSLGLGPRP
jgi:hypothetical protein